MDDNSQIEELEIKLLGINNIIDASYIFQHCYDLTEIINLDNEKFLIDMSFMFNFCTKLISLNDISNWNTSQVKKMNGMLSFCDKLISFPNISN